MLGTKWPSYITTNVLVRSFMKLCTDRYFTSAKCREAAASLIKGMPVTLEDRYRYLLCQITILNSFRDSVRQVSIKQFFKTPQRRDELYMAIIEALEDLEDEFEDIENEFEVNLENKK